MLLYAALPAALGLASSSGGLGHRCVPASPRGVLLQTGAQFWIVGSGSVVQVEPSVPAFGFGPWFVWWCFVVSYLAH